MSVATPVPLDLGGGDRGEVGVERDGSFSWLWFSYLTPTKFPEKDDHVNVLLGPLPQLWRILKVRGPMLPEPWQSPLWLLLRRLSSGWLWGRVRKGTEEACGLRAMEGWRVEVLSSLETALCEQELVSEDRMPAFVSLVKRCRACLGCYETEEWWSRSLVESRGWLWV